MVTASREFQVMAKPIGAVCNMECHYCYYLQKQHLYPQGEAFRMTDDLLEEYICQHIQASPNPKTSFEWHGGEPTLLGLEYFQKIVALQRRHQPPNWQITNGLQTNGTLLDEEWCRFLATESFSVGLSLDGPRELHDRYRLMKGQQATHRQVMQAFRLLKQHRIQCYILCTVHDQNVDFPTEIYRFFKEMGARYLQFLPVVQLLEEAKNSVSRHTVPAAAYGSFLCAIFDEWLRHDVGRVTVQIFDEAARPAFGVEHSLCLFREICGNVPVVEHNGDFFSCDHFVDPGHCLGNIGTTPLVAMLESPVQKKFGQDKREALPCQCRECEVLDMCHGGCPKDRFIRTPDGEEGLNYLCAGFKRFFTHSKPHFLKIASLWQSRQPIEKIMEITRAEEIKATPQGGRNDPCPCGSGRKYKKCCLG